MSFENIKKDLHTYEGKRDLKLDEMLALYQSLELDINAMTGSSMDQYQLSEQEAQGDSLISSLAWLGNLFNRIYTRNQTMVDDNAGKWIRRNLENAREAAGKLEQERQALRHQIGQKQQLEGQVRELERELARLREAARDSESLQRAYDELQEQCRRKRADIQALAPFDMDQARQELDVLNARYARAQEDKAAAQAHFEEQKLELVRRTEQSHQEEKQWQQKIDEIQQINGRLEQTIAAKQEAYQLSKRKNEELQRKISEVAQALADQDGSNEQLEAKIQEQKLTRQKDKDALTQLRLELNELRESNESFRANFIAPVQQEKEQAQREHEGLQLQKQEQVQQLKSLQEQIQGIRQKLPELENQVDAQSSALQAVQLSLNMKKEKLESIQREMIEKEGQKKEAEGRLAELEEALLLLKGGISTLEIQTLPGMQEEIRQVTIRREELDAQLLQLHGNLSELQQDVAGKLAQAEEKQQQVEVQQQALRKVNAQLDGLFQTQERLKQSLAEGDPEKTAADLKAGNEALQQQLTELDRKKQELADLTDEIAKWEKERLCKTDQVEEARSTKDGLEKCCKDLDFKLGQLQDPVYLQQLESMKKRQSFLREVADNLQQIAEKLPAGKKYDTELATVQAAVADIRERMDKLQEQLKRVQTYYRENVL